MTATLTVGGRDISHDTVSDVTVQVGRDNVDTQPEASVLTVNMIDGWNLVGNVGDPCTLVDADGCMFAGTITDIDSGPPEIVGDPWRARLMAAGPLAQLGQNVVGDEPWPQETDSARVYRILNLADAQHQVNPGLLGPAILARDVDAQPAAELCRSVATDALGTLWEQPADPVTPIRYTPQSLRAWNAQAITWGSMDPVTKWNTLPAGLTWSQVNTDTLPIAGAPGSLTLDCADIDAEVVFSQRLSDVVAYVRVAYGVDPGAGERPEVSAGSPGGFPQVRLDGQLALVGDAQAVANTIWRSRREPVWRLSEVTLRRDDLLAGEWSALRSALDVGTRLTINLPTSSPVGPVWQGFLEGWELRVVDDLHSVILRTSERLMTEPADRWQDVAPAEKWNTLVATLTWDTATEVA